MPKTQAAAAASTSESVPSSAHRPADKVRLGNITATIWCNAGDKGDSYSATFERSYKDGDQWKSSYSFGRDGLLVLAKAAGRAHDRILELQHESRTS